MRTLPFHTVAYILKSWMNELRILIIYIALCFHIFSSVDFSCANVRINFIPFCSFQQYLHFWQSVWHLHDSTGTINVVAEKMSKARRIICWDFPIGFYNRIFQRISEIRSVVNGTWWYSVFFPIEEHKLQTQTPNVILLLLIKNIVILIRNVL